MKMLSKTRAGIGRSIDKRIGTEGRDFVKNSSWMFSANAVRTVVAFVKSVVVARGLGVDSYGAYVLLVAFVAVIQECFDLNLGTAVVKFGAGYRAEGRSDKLAALVKASLATYVGLALLSVLAVTVAAGIVRPSVLGGEELRQYVVLYAIVSSTSFADSISASLLRLFYRFRANAIVQVATSFGDLALVTAALAIFPNRLVPFLMAMIVGKLMESLLVNGAAALELWREMESHRKASLSLLKSDWKVIAGFALSNSGSRTLHVLLDRGDVVLLGALSSPASAGVYTIAKRLGYTIMRFTDPLTLSLLPQTAALIAVHKIAEVRELLVGVTKLIAVPGLICLATAFFMRKSLLLHVYGPGFSAGADPFFVHLVMSVSTAAFFWNVAVVQSFGKVHLRLIIAAACLVLMGLLGLALVPHFGALGMAIALTGAKLSGLGLMLVLCHRLLAAPVKDLQFEASVG